MNKKGLTGLIMYRKIALVTSGVFLFITLTTAIGCQQDMGADNPDELPSFAYNSGETLAAYKISQRIPDILSEVACYCGCGETQGHENLKDCFLNEDGSFNDHGSNCHVCAAEAIDVRTWNDEGMSPEQIAAKIDAKYGEYGNPTKKVSQQEFQPGAEYEGGPRILFKEESADMGEMTPEMSRSYSFRFKNIGDEPLEIKEISVRAIEGC